MLRDLVAFPFLILVLMLQSAVISRITLLGGHADLMLVVLGAWALQPSINSAWHWTLVGSLLIGFVSGLPWPLVIIGYVLVTLLAQLLKHRVWQAPLLAMLTIVFIGTLAMNFLTILILQLLGHPLPLVETIGTLVLPSLLLNLVVAFPVYAIISDLARWLFPAQESL